ncbi:MAG: hypothetical protein IJ051_06930 [Clostridia bacterium]|nr:hypothetical protein [Clostridia bacterium]
MPTTNKRARVSTLLGNTRVMALIAFLLALVIWLAVSINESPVVERVVRDVKVEVDESMPSQLGYEAFGAENLYVDVTVSGKRYEVGDNVLTADDLTVTAVTTSVDSPGKYTLQLRAASNDDNPDYRIVSKSKDTVDVYFDAPKTIDVPVEPVVRSSGNLVDTSKYLTQDPIPSQTSVAVKGPATYVEKISHAYAYADTSGNLKNSETFDATLKIVDDKDDTINYLTTDAAENITVTVPVYQITTLPVTVSFSNTPAAYINKAPKVRISPSTIQVAVDPDKLADMKRISIGTIDFSRIESGTTSLTLRASDMTEGIPMDASDEFDVTIDTGNLSTRTITVNKPSIKVTNNATDLAVHPVSEPMQITLIGPEADLAALTASSIKFTADLTGREVEEGTVRLQLTPSVSSETCWCYGSYYCRATIQS